VTGQPAVLGFTGSTDLNAAGVYGEASASNGTTLGVFGVTRSVADLATGVIGWATDSSAYAGLTTGVWGRSSSPRGRGVVGEGPYTGVYGQGFYGVYAESTNVAVFGHNPNGFAGFFDGSITSCRALLRTPATFEQAVKIISPIDLAAVRGIDNGVGVSNTAYALRNQTEEIAHQKKSDS
jgi:hypothetical protein